MTAVIAIGWDQVQALPTALCKGGERLWPVGFIYARQLPRHSGYPATSVAMIYTKPWQSTKCFGQLHMTAPVFEMSNPSNKTALETLDALESRIQRVGWYLSGSDEVEESLQQVAAQGRDQIVQARLARLEHKLGQLSSKSQVVHDLLKFRQSVFLQADFLC